MSITDISAGRMAPQPSRTFGHRRVPPVPAPPPSPFAPAVVWQVARSSINRYWALLTGLLRQYLQVPAAWLPELWRRHREVTAWLSGQLQQIPGLASKGVKSLATATLKGRKSLTVAIKPNPTRFRQAGVRALLRSNASTTLVRTAAYVSALAVMALTAAHFVRSKPAPFEPAPSPPAAQWVNVPKPYPAFYLSSPELTENVEYTLRRHGSGARQDIMTSGTLTGAGPHLMVEIYRPAAELSRFESASLEISARLQGTDAAMVRPAGEMQTKFGPVSLVEFALKPARQCLGFVRSYENPRLQILGWQCMSGSASVDRNLAACVLDRLTLEAASEPKVRELFARAELKRNFCGERSHLMAPTPRFGPGVSPPDSKRGH